MASTARPSVSSSPIFSLLRLGEAGGEQALERPTSTILCAGFLRPPTINVASMNCPASRWWRIGLHLSPSARAWADRPPAPRSHLLRRGCWCGAWPGSRWWRRSWRDACAWSRRPRRTSFSGCASASRTNKKPAGAQLWQRLQGASAPPAVARRSAAYCSSPSVARSRSKLWRVQAPSVAAARTTRG